MFLRRLGENGNRQHCVTGYHCPQILEMSSGEFAIVGVDITEEGSALLPPGPGIGPNERMVKIPRHVIVAARREIPKTL